MTCLYYNSICRVYYCPICVHKNKILIQGGCIIFIRIKKRSTKQNGLTYDAVLVESYRNEEGLSRQRFLKHLSTIHQKSIDANNQNLIAFYSEVESNLLSFDVKRERIKDLIGKLQSSFFDKPIVLSKIEQYDLSLKKIEKCWKDLGYDKIPEDNLRELKSQFGML